MRKIQVFLTEAQKDALESLSEQTGRKQSEIVRHGVDLAIAEAKESQADWRAGLKSVQGMWQSRDDAEKAIAANRQRWRDRLDRETR